MRYFLHQKNRGTVSRFLRKIYDTLDSNRSFGMIALWKYKHSLVEQHYFKNFTTLVVILLFLYLFGVPCIKFHYFSFLCFERSILTDSFIHSYILRKRKMCRCEIAIQTRNIQKAVSPGWILYPNESLILSLTLPFITLKQNNK